MDRKLCLLSVHFLRTCEVNLIKPSAGHKSLSIITTHLNITVRELPENVTTVIETFFALLHPALNLT